jgi:hypothetical protein
MRTSRRGFLKAASAAPAIGLAEPAARARVALIRDSSFERAYRTDRPVWIATLDPLANVAS